MKKNENSVWIWALFATAVGAGVLYLPVTAGINGIWPIMLISLFTIPMVYLSHRALSRVVLVSSNNSNNINDVVSEHFSDTFCKIFAFGYFLAMYPLILIYSVGLTNTTDSALSSLLDISYIPRSVLAFIILSGLLVAILTKEKVVRKIIEYLAIPLAGFLLLLSLYLVPNWSMDNIKEIPPISEFIETFILTLPVIIFAFNFSPIISTLTLHYLNNHETPEQATQTIIWRATIIIFIFIMFFMFSCLLSIEPHHMELAKEKNMNILVYLGIYYKDPVLHYVNPIVALVAMTGAFFGTFFGAKESIIGIIELALKKHKLHSKKLDYIAIGILIIPSYILSVLDIKILTIISVVCGPVIAILLFIFPIYAIYKIKALKIYNTKIIDKIIVYFILASGILGCSAILYSFKYLKFFIK